MFLCVIQIQGEMEPDDIQLEACSTFLPPEKKEVKPYRVKTGGRARPELTWPRVTALVRVASERGVKIGVIKELVSEFRQR